MWCRSRSMSPTCAHFTTSPTFVPNIFPRTARAALSSRSRNLRCLSCKSKSLRSRRSESELRKWIPTSERNMAKYIPSPHDWVREQVELYESSGGTKGTTLLDTGLPVVIVTHKGHKTGAIRKTPLMRVKD